jgi:hypothetical protein
MKNQPDEVRILDSLAEGLADAAANFKKYAARDNGESLGVWLSVVIGTLRSILVQGEIGGIEGWVKDDPCLRDALHEFLGAALPYLGEYAVGMLLAEAQRQEALEQQEALRRKEARLANRAR